MTLQYEEIYSTFLSMVTDYSFLKNDDGFVYDQMCGWLHTACANPRIRAKFSAIGVDDEVTTVSFQLKTPVDDSSDAEFVKMVFAKSMVIAWLEPQVKNVLITKMLIGGKEERYFSQSAHLKEMQALLNDTKTELNKLLRDYGYINNSYIRE